MADFKDLDILSIGNTIQLTGAIWAGEGKMYLCMFPGEELDVRESADMTDSEGQTPFLDALNMSLDEWEQFLRQTDVMEAEILVEGPEGKPVKSIVRKSARQISQHISWSVYRRDGYHCRYCGNGQVPLTVDHLVLWEEGGPSTEANLVSACKKCNKTRGNMQLADWLQHPYYLRVKKNLSLRVQAQNDQLVAKLDDIPRMLHKPTKRK